MESDVLEVRLGLRPGPRPLGFKTSVCALFGGLTSQFGWAFLCFGLIFFWVFSFDAIQAELVFSRPLDRAQATLEAVTFSSARVNKRRVMAHHYSFSHQGKTYTGISYLTGESLNVPQLVPVEFVSAEPQHSRISLPGFRAAPFDTWIGMVVMIFPLAGLALLIAAGRLGFKTLRLMRDGRLVLARLVEQKPTGSTVKINGQAFPVYKLGFAYQVSGKTYETRVETHEVAPLTDEAQEKLLYLPARPGYARPLDAIPGKIRINAEGCFCTDRNVLVLLILPTLTLGFHGLLLLGKL